MKLNIPLVGLLCFLILWSCNNKEVKLPLIQVDGIGEIQNHSSIWIFYEQSQNDTLAILNKNNKLLNTNWIYNIDRRLTMDKLAPILTNMQNKRNEESIHKKEGMLNYFSYANPMNENISLVEFDTIKFSFVDSDNKSISSTKLDEVNIEIELKNESVIIDDNTIKSSLLAQRLDSLKDINKLSKFNVVLTYPTNLTFQNYLNYKAILANADIKLNKNEYIYTLK